MVINVVELITIAKFQEIYSFLVSRLEPQIYDNLIFLSTLLQF